MNNDNGSLQVGETALWGLEDVHRAWRDLETFGVALCVHAPPRCGLQTYARHREADLLVCDDLAARQTKSGPETPETQARRILGGRAYDCYLLHVNVRVTPPPLVQRQLQLAAALAHQMRRMATRPRLVLVTDVGFQHLPPGLRQTDVLHARVRPLSLEVRRAMAAAHLRAVTETLAEDWEDLELVEESPVVPAVPEEETLQHLALAAAHYAPGDVAVFYQRVESRVAQQLEDGAKPLSVDHQFALVCLAALDSLCKYRLPARAGVAARDGLRLFDLHKPQENEYERLAQPLAAQPAPKAKPQPADAYAVPADLLATLPQPGKRCRSPSPEPAPKRPRTE